MTDEAFPDALPIGYRLHWYVIERVLGQGGFGITHLAHDTNLDRRVAIKEYLPADFARRRSDATVRPRTEASAERYAWGLERFLAEARTLARFDHPAIVRVMSVFEANNTAYMVMRFEEGDDLATLLDRRGTLPQRQLLDCLLPILEGLQLVHEAGFIHRDVKPQNVYVRKDGTPVLLDFGSARQSLGRSKTMTILVAPGYAPLEQYYGDATTQGPWTDIYGLGATCYRAIAGHAPLDAIARAKGVLGSARDVLAPAREVGRGRYDDALLAAVDRALQLGERDRPQSVDEWRRELLGRDVATSQPAPAPAAAVAVPESVASAAPPVPGAPPMPDAGPPGSAPARLAPWWRRRSVWGLGVAAGAVAAAALLVVMDRMPVKPSEPVARLAATAPMPVPQTQADTAPAPTQAVPAPRPEASDAPPSSVGATPLRAGSDDPPPARQPAAVRTALAVPIDNAPRKIVPGPVTPAAENGKARETSMRALLLQQRLTSASAPAAIPASASSAAVPPAAQPTSVALATPAPAPEPTAPAAPAAPREATTAQRTRDEQLDSAEAALRRGDQASAAALATPWAAAGVARAQILLARTKEANRGRQQDFEAYIWYGIAARSGDAGAVAMKERVAGRLQPAEVRQADQVVEHWRPRTEASTGPSR